MKTYGNGKKATEFSKKQIGVIYGKAKKGELRVQRFVMSDLYDLADYYDYDDNGSVEFAERQIRVILDEVFAGNLERAQELIDGYTETLFSQLGLKAQKRANRELVA